MIEARSDAVRAILHRNVRSMNQGKLEVVKQEMARVNIDILGIRMISVSFQGKPFNIIVIQVYAPTRNAK